MDSRVPPAIALDALAARLRAAAPILLPGVTIDGLGPSALLGMMAPAVCRRKVQSELWLLFIAVTGAMPRTDEFRKFCRVLELAPPGLEFVSVLEASAGPASGNEFIGRSFSIISDAVVVDADFSARFGHNTGIQRVVRETLKRWVREHNLNLIAWTGDGEMPRTLSDDERLRVVDWTSDKKHYRPPMVNPDDDTAELLVPWNCTLILPEVADDRLYERMACLAAVSGNRVSMVGYDMIPVTSAEDILPYETDKFVGYLSIVKWADRVVAISESTATEFKGFNRAISSQGITGPVVETVALPIDVPSREIDATLLARDSSVPQIVSVGSHEPRKNQLAILAASEILWSAGRKFDLLFIGGAAGAKSIPFDEEIDRLKRLGRSITVLHHINDAILHKAYVESRFSMLVSKHEGFGLPIGESLAVGTPVITSSHGSMAEIAADGGCIMVDARDDDAIAAAMASLLDDDELLKNLTAEALARPSRTWDDYARELWTASTGSFA